MIEELAELAIPGLTGDVHVNVQIDGLATTPGRDASVLYEERVGGLPRCSVSMSLGGAVDDIRDLFGKEATVAIQRGMLAPPRSFRGIVRSGSMRAGVAQLELVPALWLLSQTRDSRVYQDMTVPEIVQKVVNELLGDRRYEVRLELTESYAPREYVVQHRESHLQLLVRLMFEEGIWFTFDPDDDHEILVLADSNKNRPLIENGREGVVTVTNGDLGAREQARPLMVRRSVGASEAVVSGFDWSNPGLHVEGSESGRTRLPLEVHQHDATHHGGYNGSQYTTHDADRQARLTRDRLALGRTSWMLETSVVNARSGQLLELMGGGEQDGRYFVISSRLNVHGSTVLSTLQVVPEELTYRPPAPGRGRMPGPETATVVGPGEVHADKHGRVKVQFHWDRRGQNDEHSSAWIRVAQAWAGGGHGTVFIPRVGAEVVVSYLGGDPDRPVITGGLYNGSNAPPVDLPGGAMTAGFSSSSGSLLMDDGGGSVALSSKGDMTESVGGGKSVSVGGPASMSYSGGVATEVSGGLAAQTFGGGALTTIAGGETRSVSGGSILEIAGTALSKHAGDVIREIVGKAATKITGELGEEIEGDVKRRVRGSVTDEIEGPLTQRAESVTQTISGALGITANAAASLQTAGTLTVVSSEATFTSHTSLTLDSPALELTGQSFTRAFAADTVMAQTVTTIASALVTTAERAISERGVVLDKAASVMQELGSRIESVGTDVRQAKVSLGTADILMIG